MLLCPPIVTVQQMESAICLRHCPFPYGSKGFQGARPSRFHHLKINHATPLSFPQISTTRSPVTRSFGHVNCMLERFISVPSENEGSGNRILRGVAAASLVLTCVLGLFSFSGKNMNPKLTTAYAFPFDPESAFKAPGMLALESLLIIPSDDKDLSDTQKKKPSTADVKKLKWLAIGLSKSPDSRRDEAQKTLEELYNKYCKTSRSGELEQNLELAMVEVLMFEGKVETALRLLDKIIDKLLKEKYKDNQLSSLSTLYKDDNLQYDKVWLARLILYKAILHTVLDLK